jgi:hypothetical protein
MLGNREPAARSHVSSKVMEVAKERNLQVVNVVCDEEGSQVGDVTCISFIALCPTVPRSGESIVLENGTRCVVRNVFYKTVRITDEHGKNEGIVLVPSVVAISNEPRTAR